LGYDLNIDISTTAWRRGFTNETIIQVSNQGTENAEAVHAQVVMPDEAYLLSADLDFNSPSAKTYVWELGKLAPGSVKTIHLVDSMDWKLQQVSL
jgi:hypothetical protein